MKASTKNVIKSIAVLSVIALVCVAILSLANVFLKKEVTLDKATVKFLNEKFATTAPTTTGTDSDTAYNEDYFVMLTDGELSNASGYTYKSFKSNSSNYVSAIYYAQKGANEGVYYIESVSVGYQNPISVVVSFVIDNGDFSIQNIAVKEQREDFGDRKTQVLNPETFFYYVSLVKSDEDMNITDADIIAATGATTKKSVAGLNRAVTRAIDTMNKIYTKSDEIKAEINKRGGQNG
ncbi:MAG: FMN-binding protein [Clostridia bacterium]|nr:FMN-binding protein [Clostridia bacterium]